MYDKRLKPNGDFEVFYKDLTTGEEFHNTTFSFSASGRSAELAATLHATWHNRQQIQVLSEGW